MATAKALPVNEAEVVLVYLARGNSVVTRLREKSQGDFHDCPMMPDEIRVVGISAPTLIALLERLHRQDLVRRFESVTAFDSSEYIIVWNLR